MQDQDAVIELVSIGPANVCYRLNETDLAAANAWDFDGIVGSACEARFRANETDDFAATDFTVTTVNSPAGHISWSLTEGPPLVACFKRIANVPQVVYEVTSKGEVAASGTVSGLDISYIDPRGKIGRSWDWMTVKEDASRPVPTEDRERRTAKISVNPEIPNGSRLIVEINAHFPGRHFVSFDDPIVFRWTFDDNC